ncbi:MAG: TonB-dependent receptor domain-containing protein [Sphingomonadaceae bacterium]
MKNQLKLAAAPMVLGIALAAQPAFAQSEGQGATAENTVITVTGSRIVQPNLDSSSPLAVTTAEEIGESGYTRLEDVLVTLPQIEAAQNAFISNGATGTATLDLRGLGSVRTLVLVNGRRMQPGSVNAVAADINQIPGALVRRIDVTTGGASSVYGADAVAGVVNFIMDTEFEGFQLDGGISYYMHDNGDTFVTDRALARGFTVPTDTAFDGRQINADLALGGKFGEGGHAVVYAGYRKINAVFQGDRDHSVCALNAAGTACGGSGTTPVPNFFISPIVNGAADFDQELFLTLGSNNAFIPSVGNVYNFAPINYFQRPDERFTLGGFVNYEVSSAFNPYAEVMYMNNRSVAQIAESGTFFVEEYAIPCSSPLFTAAQSAQLCGGLFNLDPATDSVAVYVGKRNVEGGGRQNIIQHDSFRIVTGARGQISPNWNYDAYVQYGQSSLSDSYLNDFLLPAVGDALNVTRDGSGNIVCANPQSATCQPYLVFQNGAITPEAAASLGGTATRTGVTKQFLTSAYVTGDTGFGIAQDNIAMVFGVEYRKEIYRAVSDFLYENGLLLGQGGATPSVEGKFDVAEFFTEANVPLVQGASFAQDLRLELGYRFSHYNVTGGSSTDTHTFKAQINWEVNDMFRLRGGYNRAVRAPNAPELFQPTSLGLWAGNDPCAGATPELTAAQCALTGVSAAQYGNVTASPASQYNAQFSGNLNLRPEKADTYTAGIVVTPTNSTSFSVDYYRIKMSNVIGIYPQEQLIRDCGLSGDADLCSRIVRSPSGDLWRGTAGFVVSANDNLAGRDFQGIDVAASARFPLGNGSLNLGLTGSYLLKKEYQDAPTTTPYDCEGVFSTICYVSPNWRHTFRVSWKAPEVFTITGKWRFMSSVDGPAANGATSISDYSWFDLAATADVTENFSLTLAANNLFDKNPPLVGGSFSSNGNTYAGMYDTLGRYVSIQGSMRF